MDSSNSSSPEHAAHLDMVEGGPISADYYLQVQWEMCCTIREWADFASYHPDFPSAMRLADRRIKRDDATIIFLETEVRKFLAELNARLEALKFHEPGALMESLKASA